MELFWVLIVTFTFSQGEAIFQDPSISSLLPCGVDLLKSANLNYASCKVPIILTVCRDYNSSFAQRYPEKIWKYDFQRQIDQALALIKSIAISYRHDQYISISPVQLDKIFFEITIFTNDGENGSFKFFQNEISRWIPYYNSQFRLIHRRVIYLTEYSWMSDLFAPCATLRLQLPKLLPHEDSILYLDTDILALGNILKLWSIMGQFGPSTMIAMSRQKPEPVEREVMTISGMSNVLDFNSGVMLFNLTRARTDPSWYNWHSTCQQYSDLLDYPDQDIMNMYFHQYPHKLFELPCQWNWLPFFLRTQEFCQIENGHVNLIHGTGRLFLYPGALNVLYRNYVNASLNANAGFQVSRFVSNIIKEWETVNYCGLKLRTYYCVDSYFQKGLQNAIINYQ